MDEWGNGDCMNEKRGGKPVVYTLKELNSVLGKISSALAQLELTLRTIVVKRMMREIVFNENRKVLELINRLQGYLEQITGVIVLFDGNENHGRIQAELKVTLSSLTSIKSCLLDLYKLKNEHDLQQYNPAIKAIVKTAHTRVKNALVEVETRVDSYNQNNSKKLLFKIKWVTLKEDAE